MQLTALRSAADAGLIKDRKGRSMIYMHCRIRVADVLKWKSGMEADAQAQGEAGMFLKYLWRGVEDPNMAFFILEVHDIDKARAFLNPIDVAKAKKAAGVIDFEWHFIESVTVHQV